MCRSGLPEVALTSPRISSNTETTESPSTPPVSALHVTWFFLFQKFLIGKCAVTLL